MMVLGVNSKRQRRPNVRLGEIGDVSAAVSCRTSWKLSGNWELKKPKQNQSNTDGTQFHLDSAFSSHKSSFVDSDPGVSPRLDTHNRENRNPNSLKAIWEFTSLESNASMSKLNFGKVTRKGRLMKRRGRSVRDGSFIGSCWNSGFSFEFDNENRKFGPDDAIEENEYHSSDDLYALEEHKYPNETSDVANDTHENGLVDPVSDIQAHGDSDEIWTDYISEERNGFSCDDDHHFDNKTTEFERASDGVIVVHDVKQWLEELGFGKYVRMFEIHEVDGEVLPLLTFEDLKEMGIDAVGPRRKIFTAIQNLNDRPST